jgi:two-component system response regulator AtoC
MSTLLKIFVVEDDPYYARLIQHHLSAYDAYYVEVFLSGNDLLNNLNRQPDIITLDFGLPDIDGIALISKIKEFNSEVPIVVVSGQSELSNAIKLFKAGAFDYVIKNPDTMDKLLVIIEKLRDQLLSKKELGSLRMLITKNVDNTLIQGQSKEIERIMNWVQIASHNSGPVLIQGEEGSGKIFIAKSIHFNSSRSFESFVEYSLRNNKNLDVELEIFGYEKDSMPGIHVRKKGKIGEAKKGTFYIDEISHLDMNSQNTLLKIIQEQKFTRIGSKREINTDVRIIASTQYNLSEQVERGEFNSELFFVLSQMQISVLPLRERKEDIILLSDYFVQQFCDEFKIPLQKISKKAQKKLIEYSYPGNITELKSIINRAITSSSNNIINPENIFISNPEEDSFSLDKEYTMQQYNDIIINYYLKKYNNNISIVSNKLNISKSTIYRLLKNGKEKCKTKDLRT